MAQLPAAADAARRGKRQRFYVFKVFRVVNGGPEHVSVMPCGPFPDLVSAWQMAGWCWVHEPGFWYVAGELGSTQTAPGALDEGAARG